MKTKLWQAIVAVALAALILLPLVACGDTSAKPAETAGNSAGVSTGVSTSATGNETATAPATPEPTPEPIPEPTPEPDPYAVLEVSEEWARERGGFYLRRGEKLYTLYSLVPRDGSNVGNFGFDQIANNAKVRELYSATEGGFMAHGDIPELIYEDGDELVSFKDTYIILAKYEFAGYGLNVTEFHVANDDYVRIYVDGQIVDRVSVQAYKNSFEIRDENDNLVDGYVGLEQGETYTVSWFEGVNYHEWKLMADSRFYREVAYDSVAKNVVSVRIDGDLHREGYASFDLAKASPEIEPSIYSTKAFYGAIWLG